MHKMIRRKIIVMMLTFLIRAIFYPEGLFASSVRNPMSQTQSCEVE